MLNRFHSAVLEVADFDAAVAHYGTLLGRRASWVGANRDRGTRSAFFRLANMHLEIRTVQTGALDDAPLGLRVIRLGSELEGDDLSTRLAERGVGVVDRNLESSEHARGTEPWQWNRFAIDPASSRGIGLEIVQGERGAPTDPAPLDAEPGASVHDLDHVVVFSPAVEATRAFYADALGIRLALDKTFEARKVRLVFFRLGYVTIEIGSRLDAEPAPEAADRFGGLAWEVGEVDAIRERLADAGFDVSEARAGHKPGTRVCTVRNPTYEVPTLLIQPVSR